LQAQQFSAYIQGDSAFVVMAINASDKERDIKITLPYNVKSGELWLSTGNESDKLCQKSTLEDLTESTNEYLYTMPAMSLNTFILKIDKGSTAIEDVKRANNDAPKTYYDLQGRRLEAPHGVCIERSTNGHPRKIMIK
jgi:glucuronoarabinoxylan endo-1,4-beta-xylanase